MAVLIEAGGGLAEIWMEDRERKAEDFAVKGLAERAL